MLFILSSQTQAQSRWHTYAKLSLGTTGAYGRSGFPIEYEYLNQNFSHNRLGAEAGFARLKFGRVGFRQYGVSLSVRGLKQYGFVVPTDSTTAAVESQKYRYVSIELPIGINLFLNKKKPVFSGLQARIGYNLLEKAESHWPSFSRKYKNKSTAFPKPDRIVLGWSVGYASINRRWLYKSTILLDMSDTFLRPKYSVGFNNLHDTHYYAGLEINRILF